MKKKAIIGLSGGVDSSVAAALLIRQGYDVEGVFMRNWDSALNSDVKGNPTLDDAICTQEADFNDARNVADHLKIPLHRVDFVHEYWNDVFSHFLDSYRKGLTPNPDVLCNNTIKFHAFVRHAKTLSYDVIAMGHYARTDVHDGRPRLLRAIDTSKDQSYFLSQLTEDQLDRVVFPIGDLEKSEVRRIAREEGIPTAEKKDSTGICFIGERDFGAFLSNYLPAMPGRMTRLDGTYVKDHGGLMNYTIGQRRGLGIGGSAEADGAWYVVGKDLVSNTLYVEPDRNHPHLWSDRVIVRDVIWRGPRKTGPMTAKFRYRQKDIDVITRWLGPATLEVRVPGHARSVTPGQAAVFYDGAVCLGGGFIEAAYMGDDRRQYV